MEARPGGLASDPAALVAYYSVTFGPGPMLLKLGVSPCFQFIEVEGFGRTEDGRPGPAERSGRIAVGDVLLGVGDTTFHKISFDSALHAIAAAKRPVTLRFARQTGECARNVPPGDRATLTPPCARSATGGMGGAR